VQAEQPGHALLAVVGGVPGAHGQIVFV
jgi:hypothetical protein